MKKSKKQEQEPQGKIVFAPDARHITDDELVRLVMGKSMDQFIKDIILNKNGEYDSLYY